MQFYAKPVFALQLPTSTSEIFLQMLSVFSISLFYSTNELQENYEVSQILTEFVVTVFLLIPSSFFSHIDNLSI